MEYVQLTLNDWIGIKNELEQELRNAAAGFVRIGYLLRRAEESEGYKNDGYDTLTEWAQDNYGLTPSQVSRFKAINKRYSIDGYSNQLKLEYANYGQSKLTEMLTLSDEGMEMVSPEMKREDIREIKAFERQAPNEEPVHEAKDQWIIEYVKAKDLARLKDTKAFRENDLRKMIDEVIPSGAGTFRHKKTMVSMFPDRIMVREFPNPPEQMAWEDFLFGVREAIDRIELEAERPGANVPPQPTIQPMPQPEEQHEEAERVEEQADTAPEEKKTVPEETGSAPAAGEEPAIAVAPAQENEESTVSYSGTAAELVINDEIPTTHEEPEQVEIDEILPAPVDDPYEELKDRFREVMGSLRVMLDANNFESMDIPIERLKILKGKLIAKKEELV